MIYFASNVRKATLLANARRIRPVHFGMQIPPPLCAPPRKFSPVVRALSFALSTSIYLPRTPLSLLCPPASRNSEEKI